MLKKCQTVCIVGGGSSGWMVAAYYLYQIPDLKIILIESPTVLSVGVGEATILGFDEFLESCGMNTAEWMAATDAIFKCGILFPGWRDETTPVWHPFNLTYTRQNMGDLSDIELWHNVSNKEQYDYNTYAVGDWDTCVLHNKVTPINKRKAYHLDCIKLANFLSNKCKPYLEYISSNVNNVQVSEEGISKLILENDQEIIADLYIDCTGFKKLLSNSLPESNWINKDKMLFLNSAVATQINYVDPKTEMTPYTTAQAVDFGWIWKTPIQDRIGSGLVYDSDLLTPEQAESEFVKHWGENRLVHGRFNHIKFKPEFNTNNWRKNCISVGLASGFIEPLESTGLQLIIDGIVNSADAIKKGFYTEYDQKCFNSTLSIRYDNATDFIGIHYLNNRRTGKFWRKVQENIQPTDTLLATIEQYQYSRQLFIQQSNKHLFGAHNKNIWFDAVGIKYLVPQVPEDQARQLLEESYINRNKWAYTYAPTNYELAKIRNDQGYYE
jgi:tryptophan halogenase